MDPWLRDDLHEIKLLLRDILATLLKIHGTQLGATSEPIATRKGHPMRSSWDPDIHAAGLKIVEYLLDRIDPDEIRYPTYRSTAPLRISLEETLEGAIADWLQEKRGA